MSDLDDAESRAIGMIQFFQEQCAKQCEPYVKIIAQIRSIRPQTFVVDGQTMALIMGATDQPMDTHGSATNAPVNTSGSASVQPSVCLRCHGKGAIDAATSADDPSCPDCDGEGVKP